LIVHCPDCSSKYEIAAAKIPEGGIKVRCPRCKAVFPIRSVGEEAPVPVFAARPASNGPEREAPEADEEPEPPPRKPKLVTDPVVASRMARAIVYEILLPRKSEHQASLSEGTVLSRFGPDLTRALGLYKDRVSPGLPDRDAFFRDAVNDILGAGSRLL